MAKMGKFSASDMKKLQKQLAKLQDKQAQAFVEACTKELAARLLAKAIKRTPVGKYWREIEVVAKRDSKYHKKGDVYTKRVNPSGKLGGTLRRGWTAKTQEEAANGRGKPTAEQVTAFLDTLEIERKDNYLVLEIKNPVEYASYVEYGHRTANHKGWVPGQFMLTLSVDEVQKIAPKVLQSKIEKFLGECLK